MIDYYAILGLNKEATDAEIKKAYRKLAKEKHPDVGGDEDEFKAIAEAYGVLSDGAKRDRYDRGEPVETESKEGRARRNIGKIFDTLLNLHHFDPLSTDIPKYIAGQINETLIKMDDDIDEIRMRIGILEDVKGRIEGANYLIEQLDSNVAMLTRKISNIEEEIEIAGIMSELVEEFKYEKEDEIKELECGEEFGAFW